MIRFDQEIANLQQLAKDAEGFGNEYRAHKLRDATFALAQIAELYGHTIDHSVAATVSSSSDSDITTELNAYMATVDSNAQYIATTGAPLLGMFAHVKIKYLAGVYIYGVNWARLAT